VSLPVQVRPHDPHSDDDREQGFDLEMPDSEDSQPSAQATHFIDVSHRGARVGGVSLQLKPGEVVNLVSDGCDARFLVIWVGEPGTAQEGQIGLQSLATD
jgi:hypothetical protein